jgi:hypothetical protein
LELLEGTLLNHYSILDNCNTVTLLNSGQAVSDYNGSAPLHNLLEGGLNLALTVFIQGTSCLVKKQNMGLADDSTSNCNALLLATGKLGSSSTALDLVTLVHYFTITDLHISSLVKSTFDRSEFTLRFFF